MFIALLLTTWMVIPGADPASPAAATFEDFAPQSEFPSADLVHAMLRPVEGYPGEVSESTRLGRPGARIAGLFRYEEVWPAGSALRVSLADVQAIQIHLWAGPRGVSLRFRSDAGRSGPQWAVYGAERQGQTPRPDQLALWATDEGRFRRTGEGTFELRWSEGVLAMSRGDAVLWRVPLEHQPSEVYFDGTAIVRGLGTFRSTELPRAPTDLPVARDVPKPADLEWREDLPPGVALNKLPDGSVELSAAERSKSAQVSATLVPAGLQEFVFALENPQAGTGVYLGDESGEPLARVGFFRSRGRAGLTFGLVSGKNAELERNHPDGSAVPYAGSRPWIRLVLAAGIARLWTSGDGRHWSQPPEGTMRATGGCRGVGLYCLADQAARSLRLRSLQVRKLDALATLAPADLVGQVYVPPQRSTRGRWSAGRMAERPAGVGEDAWQRAFALRTLIESPNSGAGQAALGLLVREAVERSSSIDESLTLLAQAARITDNGESGHSAAVAAVYELLGRRLVAQRDPAPYTRIRKAMLDAPLVGLPPGVAYGWASGQLLRYELLLAAYEGRWDELARQCREAQFWSRSRDWSNQPVPAWEQIAGPTIDWATAQLEAHRRTEQAQQAAVESPKAAPQPTAPPSRAGRGRGPRPVSLADTTHPLVDRLGKEASNVAADLDAALAGGSLREACQIIRNAGSTATGLVPSSDPQLSMALQVSLERAFAAHPQLTRTMEQNFGPLAALRFKQAAESGAVAAVEALADQFPGTQAAGLAEQWLGDRALAAGQFPQALCRYRRALAAASTAESSSVAARTRLAGAILGKSLGEPPSAPVELGDARLPAAEFEQLLATLRGTDSTSPPASALPAASAAVDVRPWAAISAGPEQRFWNSRRPLDLAARQTAVRFSDQVMLVSTPARLMAFRLPDGQPLWNHGSSLEPDRSQSSSPSIDPVIFGARAYLRRSNGRVGQLACVSLSDGKLLWTTADDAPVISDPLPVGPCVFALLAGPGQAGLLMVQVGQFDSATGRLLARWPTVELRDLWQGTARGRAVWADDTLVATVGGCVIACDPAGRLRWVRRQMFLSPQIDYQPSRSARTPEAPRVAQGRVYATQPGVCGLECLELATGRLVWRRAEPDLVSLVGADAQRVILATGMGLVALDSATGRPLWSREDLEPLETGAFLGGAVVLHAVLRRNRQGPPEVSLQWLDAATGQVKATATLPVSWDRRSAFGPLALGAGRLWAILARGEDPQRQLVELKLTP